MTTKDSWYRIQNSAGGDVATIFLMEEVGLWGVTAAQFVQDLRAIKARRIDLRISSPGGEIFDGVAMYSALKNHPATVTVYIDGLAASAASFIAMAGDRIVAEKHSTMMIHEGMGIAVGAASDMRDMAALLDKCSDNIASIYAERAGGSVEFWRARMREETWYTAEEAKTAGLVDEVAGTPATAGGGVRVAAAWDLSVFNYAGRAGAPAPVLSEWDRTASRVQQRRTTPHAQREREQAEWAAATAHLLPRGGRR